MIFMKHKLNITFQKKFLNDPYVDWLSIVMIGVVVGALAVASAVFLFLDIRDNGDLAADVSSTAYHPPLNAEELARAVALEANKVTESKTIRTTPYVGSVDPSFSQ